MGNSPSTSRGDQETMADSKLVDFREIVLVWAKDTAPKRLSSRSDTDYDINWGKLRINTGKAEYPPTAQKLVSSSVILSKSSIDNGTEKSQDNEVILEGSYKATHTITLTKAFTIGEQTKLDLSLPDEMVKAGFDKTLSITEIEKHLQTKEQTWKMTTKVTVPPHEKKTVEQTITVNQYSSTFKVPTDISGKVHVTMYKTNGNEKRFLMSLEPVNIAHVMKHVEQRNKLSVPHAFWEVKESSVCVTTEGECEFMYGVEQNVNTTTVPKKPTWVHPSPSRPLYPTL